MRVKIQEAPLELRRRVAHKLESVRGTEMAPNSKSAVLGDTACPIYRHDIKGVAYWEFEILGLKGVLAREHSGKSSGAGFIIASVDSHDVPIPHWSFTTEPPSRALESKVKKGNISRIVKLDTLCYAAEDEKGNYLAHIGQFPVQIPDQNTAATSHKDISTVTAMPKQKSTSDKSPGELVMKAEGAKPQKLKLVGWESYAAFKRSFAKTYTPHLKALAGRASQPWEFERLIIKFGEGIHEGSKLTVPLLSPGKVSVTGDGSKLVKVLPHNLHHGGVSLEALPSTEKKETYLHVEISYADGTKEKLQYFVVPKGTPTNRKSTLPHFINKV